MLLTTEKEKKITRNLRIGYLKKKKKEKPPLQSSVNQIMSTFVKEFKTQKTHFHKRKFLE